MRFVDNAVIMVRSGKGGKGSVSFRREKFIPKGGPDGGDGGNGGDVILRANPKLLTLYDFRLKRLYEAENGRGGQGACCFGAAGQDLVVDVPVGTEVYISTGETEGGVEGERLLADLTTAGQIMVVAHGGRGGKGNTHFKSATMRTPRFAQPGEPGEELRLRLELKIMADVGIIGLPNAGKSTLISQISAAKPKIASYPFTTLVPQLGVLVNDADDHLVVADIPGLVEGAHTGQGLGHTFLKHVERTRFLLHLLSIEDMDPENFWAGFDLINQELALFSPILAEKKQILVINKIDLANKKTLKSLRDQAASAGKEVFFISAMHGDGLDQLVSVLWERFLAMRADDQAKEIPTEGDHDTTTGWQHSA